MVNERKKQDDIGGTPEFFRVALSHTSLENHIKTNFSLMQHHKYSYTDLESMLPWERQLYVTLLVQYVEEENDKRKQ